MNGSTEFLIDTNIFLGLVKNNPAALALLDECGFDAARCFYSPISRMEALGYPAITPEEDHALTQLFALLRPCPLDSQVENATIALRRTKKIKLPDAIIAATAKVHSLKLLTLDQGLLAAFSES